MGVVKWRQLHRRSTNSVPKTESVMFQLDPRKRNDWVFYTICAVLAVIIVSFMIYSFRKVELREQLRLERDVAEGRRMPSGEQIVRDPGTGCEYIRVVTSVGYFGSGFTLVPRLGADGKPMGCGQK